MSLYELEGMMRSLVKKTNAAPTMTDEEFDQVLADIRELNLPDVVV